MRAGGLVVCCLLLWPASVRADGYDAAMAQAAVAKETALDSGSPVDWELTLSRFLAADALRATRESKYEIAVAARALKADDLAVEAYEASIALGLDGAAREKADAFLAENAPKMARLTVLGPAGTAVVVNARRRGVLPLGQPLVVFAGTVTVRASIGTSPVEKTLQVGAGEGASVDLSPPPPEPVPVVLPPPRRVPEAPAPDHGLDWAMAIGGGAVLVTGVVTWAIATATVNARRASLDEVCLRRREDDPDLCAEAADATYRDWAQEDSDLIHTFKPLRTVGLVGASIGLVVGSIGVVRLLHVTPTAHVSSKGATFGLQVAF